MKEGGDVATRKNIKTPTILEGGENGNHGTLTCEQHGIEAHAA